MTDDTWVAGDGRRRCGWLPRTETDFSYHDEVWGTPTHDQRALFEALSLGIFEIGMSWEVVFHRRQAFRTAFDDFGPARVGLATPMPTCSGWWPTRTSSATTGRSRRSCTTRAWWTR